MSYDVKCYLLAKHFLSDVDREDDADLCGELAQEIQNAIEAFCEERGLQA